MPVHHLCMGPSGPYCINNADKTSLIGRDNWCLEGVNPKDPFIATQVKSALRLPVIQMYICWNDCSALCRSFAAVDVPLRLWA